VRLALGAIVALAWPGIASAQGWKFLDNSPGPLVRGHHDLDNPDGCTKCHVFGEGVLDRLCKECHKTGKSSLHQSFGAKKCVECHGDHKGRTANISDWNQVGGRRSFDHGRTEFALTGVHEKVACTKCHLRKLESGRTSFMGLDPTCAGCHGNTHRFTSKELLGKCVDCHGKGGARRNLKAGDLFFDHAQRTGLALSGKHAKAACNDCHRQSNMSMAKKRGCADCHRKDSPHGRGFARADCKGCHSIESFDRPTFSHEKTKFPLRGEHDTKRCSKCHESPKKKPAATCSGCHGDPHRERFTRLDCATCHALGGKKKIERFDHARNAEFALTGRHSALACRSCHRGKGPTKFERLQDGLSCRTCHAHAKAHDGQFDDKQCTGCHVEGGSKKLDFDHQADTRFPLVGMHQKVKCEKCHEGGTYKSNKLACIDCHQDSHEGQLGDKCDKCHSPEVKFEEIEFDHDRLSRFELVGLHEKVECEKCHPKRRYKTAKLACADCHFDDDPHKSQLGIDCAKCHVPEKGAPRFVHDDMTRFPLTGRHQAAQCEACHRRKPESPPKVGWTKGLVFEKLDLRFPKMGQTCADCHFDVHEGGYGKDCSSCHDPTAFEASRAIHDTGAFRLMGRHDQLACITCHTENRKLAGVGAQCFVCHQKDDEHNNALGFECGSCHQQLEWFPARFNHTTVGYQLRGVHAAARCRDCHRVGTYAGTPRECQLCHGSSAMAVIEPPHTAELADCQACHTEVSFTPARPVHPWYPLEGVHRTNRCTSCHIGGVYVGTPRECIACHQADFIDPRNEPNHVLEGFSTDCAECHNSVTWEGARLPAP
jgi:hypothetical protein